MKYEEVEKNCREHIKKRIEESAGTKDFSVIYTVWNPLCEFVLEGSECGRRSSGAEVVVGTGVYSLYDSYRRLVVKVREVMETVYKPVLEQGNCVLRCEETGTGVLVHFEVEPEDRRHNHGCSD